MNKRFAAAVPLLLLAFCLPVSAEPVKVFVMAGQSNMVGSGNPTFLPDDVPVFQADVLYHYRISSDIVHTSADWSSLTTVTGTFGPELSFGRTVADALPGEQIAIIKVAANGTHLFGDWNVNAVEGRLLYSKMLDHIDLALSQLPDTATPQIEAFVWVQGSSDAFSERAPSYESNLTDLFAAVRTDLGNSQLPIVFNQLHEDTVRESLDVIRAAQAAVDAADANAHMVNFDDLGLRPDNLHFSTTAHAIGGKRLANAYLAAVPEPGTACVILATGAALLLRRRPDRPSN